MSRFLDERLGALVPYTPGEQPDTRDFIKLNTNESPYRPSPGVLEAVAEQAGWLQLYPSLDAADVMGKMARYLDVGPHNIMLGNGSDELLAFVFQALCPHGAAFPDLTYGFYPVYCGLYGVKQTILPLREDFTVAPRAYFGLGKTVFIANPNAPTGLALHPDQIEDILQYSANSLVVVDEAYVNFGAESCVGLIHRYDNLLVVGTFSKSRSMAGARLGYAVGDRALIEDLNRIRFSFNPYNVNRMTLAAAGAALDDHKYYADCWRKIMLTRARAAGELVQMGFTCTDSLANFIFAQHDHVSGEELHKKLKQRGILVRWFDLPRIQNRLRITVGSDEEMDRLLEALREILATEN